MHKKTIEKNGFTLIELLIVVAIIAILASIALVNFMNAQTRAKVARAEKEMQTIAVALESYYVENNDYPVENYESPSNVMLGGLMSTPNLIKLIPLTTPVAYITTIPSDPFTTEPNPLNHIYHYASYNDLLYPYPDFFQGDNEEGIRCMWVLESNGPDRDPKPYQFPRYDPTNGTNSVGNILRFGP